MRVAYVRSGGPRDRAYLSRLDGSTATIHPHSYGGGFPHDLAHFVVERALGLRAGFWGLLADGVDWQLVNDIANRGGKHVLERDTAELRLAEGAVALVSGDGTTEELVAAYRAEHVDPPDDLEQRVAVARTELAQVAAEWAAVPVDGQLLLDWPAEP